MQKLNFRSISRILGKTDRNHLFLLAISRITANGLDLVGLAGIALLAAAFGSIASGDPRANPIELPLLGQLVLTATEAIVIASFVVGTFVLKSGFSVWLHLKTALRVAEIEIDFAKRLTTHFFTEELVWPSSVSESVSSFQTKILVSTSSMAGFLRARIALIAEGSLLIGLLFVFFIVNPLATVSTLAYLVLVVIVLNSFLNKRLRSNSENVVAGSQTAISSSRDLFGVRREVTAIGIFPLWLEKIASGKRLAATGSARNFAISALPRYIIETALILGIFLFLGAVVLFSDLATEATTIGIFLAGGLRLVASLLPLQAAYNSIISTSAAAQMAFQQLVRIAGNSSRVREDAEPPLVKGPMGVTFRDVEYRFPDSDEPVISPTTLEITANTKTAIVGPSGAGKTTLVELAAGFRLPTRGTIQTSGISPRTVLENAPGAIGIVPQRPFLISGSLAENVSLEPGGVTDFAKAAESLSRAGMQHLIGSDLDGLSAIVQPDGSQFSGGEVQRIGLARALYREPKLLFLDEATSALDAQTELKISEVLDSLRDHMTIVLIAHRLSTVKNADKIIYVDKGCVVAEGSFAELQRLVPEFAEAIDLMGLD